MARSSENERSILEFAKRRALRIYPLYLTAWLARYLIFLLTTNSPDWRIPIRDFVGALTLFGDFWNAGLVLGNVDWSLRVEVVAYSAVAMSILFIPASFRTLYLTLISCILVLAPSVPTGLFSAGYLNIHLPIFVAGFAVGSNHKVTTRGSSTLALCINILVCLISAGIHRPDLASSIFFYSNVVMSVLVFMSIERMRSYRAGRIVTYLSETSYGVYLMHNWLVYWIADSMFGKRDIIARSVSLCLVIALSKPLHTYIEKPAMRLARRRSPSRKEA